MLSGATLSRFAAIAYLRPAWASEVARCTPGLNGGRLDAEAGIGGDKSRALGLAVASPDARHSNNALLVSHVHSISVFRAVNVRLLSRRPPSGCSRQNGYRERMRRPLTIVSLVLAGLLVLCGSIAAGLALVWSVSSPLIPLLVDSTVQGGRQTADEGSYDEPALEADDDFGTVEVYDVLDDGSLDPAASGTAGEVWQLFVRLVGAETAASSILQFKAGDAPDSDTLAYVYQDRDPQYWTLVINLATANDPELLVATLVHEYAHVFSYAPSEFDPKADTCATFEVIEGCVLSDAYLWAFYDAFWAGYDEHPDWENVDSDIAYEFYLKNEEDFVSDYAATNIGEDFAESFMTFVLEDDWSPETPTGAKLAFFTQYPELVELREQMRAAAVDKLGL